MDIILHHIGISDKLSVPARCSSKEKLNVAHMVSPTECNNGFADSFYARSYSVHKHNIIGDPSHLTT